MQPRNDGSQQNVYDVSLDEIIVQSDLYEFETQRVKTQVFQDDLVLSRGAITLRSTRCWFRYPAEPDKGWDLPGPQGGLYSTCYYW